MVRFFIWKEDGRKLVESTGEQSSQQLDGVGQVDGDLGPTTLLDVLPNDIDLSSDVRYGILDCP